MHNQIDWVACERLIGSLASKFQNEGVELDDLKQEARVAVLQSHGDYSSNLGVSYNTFIGRRIRDALRSFVGANTDALEVGREWIAEAIGDGPEKAIRATTKEECERLRSALGAERFKKAKRVIHTSRATVHLDACADGEESMHDVVGTGPEQEAMLTARETLRVVEKASNDTAKIARNGGAGDYWQNIARMRDEGYTFEQIGEKLGKSANAIKKAWARAEKRIGKKAA